MNKKPLLSIIVPVYNTEQYLERCLDSILKQTYKNIEIIIVDDCSPDQASQIINKYIEKDTRIKYVKHEKNRGLFQARITGVEVSTGDYIAFVDSDDYISIDYYRMMINQSIKTNSDMVLADWVYAYEDGRKEYLNLDGPRNLNLNVEGEAVLETFMNQKGLCFSWQLVWNKIYKRSLWNQCYPYYKQLSDKHGHLIMTEDIAFSCVFWMMSQKVTNVHDVLYFYSQNEGQSTGITTSFEKYKKNLTDVLGVFDFFEEILKKNNKFETYESQFKEWKQFYGKIYYGNSINTGFESSIREELIDRFDMPNLSKLSSSDNFFYSQRTPIKEEFKWFEDIKSYISDDMCEYVSFDIFDTLILRPFLLPTDLFYLINEDFIKWTNAKSYVDFAQIRIESEKNCRSMMRLKHPSYEDITLDEIYEYMQENYCISKEVIEKLKEREKELEIRFCTVRNTGKQLYELAKECNKKIILVSDMYLPLEVINKILEKNQYDSHEKVFLSSEIRLGKWTGNLFKYVLKDLHIDNPSSIGHIGDNWDSDVVMARNAKFQSFHIAKTTDIFKNLNPGNYTGQSYERIFMHNGKERDMQSATWGFTGLRSMLAVVANKIFDNPYNGFNSQSDFNANPYYIGYFTLGMHLYAVADWLLNDIDEKDCNTIHFVARDGYILQKAYDIMAVKQKKQIKSNYIYLSRKALALIDIYDKVDLYSLINKMNIYNASPKKIIEMYGTIIGQDRVIESETICKNNGFIYDKRFSSRYEYERFIKLLGDIILTKEDFLKYKKELKEYFESIISKGDVLFDLGYSGRAEAALSKLLEFPVDSYYIHSNSEILDTRKAISTFSNKMFYDYRPAITGVMREHMFMQLAPSTIGYDLDSDPIKPIFEEYQIDYQTQFITDIVQNAGLDFIRDFTETFNELLPRLNYRGEDASQPFEYYLHYSKEFDRNIFSSLVFEDDFGEGKKLYAVNFWNKETERYSLNKNMSNGNINSISQEMLELYSDGLLVAFIRKINNVFPKGSRKRELLKKVAGKFMK